MKKTFFIASFLFLSLSFNAQKLKNAQDSIQTFYNKLFFNLESSYLHKNEINWKNVKSETENNLIKYSSFERSLKEIKPLFDKIGADHCGIYYKNNHYSSSTKSINNLLSEEWKTKYATKPNFEVKIIDGDIGYILIPRIIFFDINEKSIHNAAQPIYDEIAKLKAKKNLKGWIIDLRFNTGGNSTPMLLALYDFLGNNNIWGTVGLDKKVKSIVKLNSGIYYDNSKRQGSINPVTPLLDQSKVALIIGPATGSAGEIVALAFKERPNTVFIGEETYGATTSNIEASLPFNITMALTTGLDSDRNGKTYGTIVPDITIVKQDNFDNLLLDKKIEKAIGYIKT